MGNVWELDQECWNYIPRSDNFKRLDQAINSDVARALINIPMGKVDQLSWSTRQYWSHLNERVEWELCCQLFNSWFEKFLDKVAWSRKLIKKIASVPGALHKASEIYGNSIKSWKSISSIHGNRKSCIMRALDHQAQYMHTRNASMGSATGGSRGSMDPPE